MIDAARVGRVTRAGLIGRAVGVVIRGVTRDTLEAWERLEEVWAEVEPPSSSLSSSSLEME